MLPAQLLPFPFSPLFQGSVTATKPCVFRQSSAYRFFQSPIPRVGHCNAAVRLIRPFVQLFQSPIPRVGHCNFQYRQVAVPFLHRFQSPIPRVGHCNGTAAGTVCQGDDPLSVPYSKGRSLQRIRFTTDGGQTWPFSPLFQGSVTATHVQRNHAVGQVSPFSPLFQGSVTATRPRALSSIPLMPITFQSPIPRVGHCNF